MTKLDLISNILMLGFKLHPNCYSTYGLNGIQIYISSVTNTTKIYSNQKVIYKLKNGQYEKIWDKLIKII